MKRIYLFVFVIASMLLIGTRSLNSTPMGAPSDGRTGSPGDGGKTCYNYGCHSGAPTAISGVITTNVPDGGYIGGVTYTVTVSLPYSNKKGFCISPQKADGTLMGSLINGSGNAVTNVKYVTHTSPKIANPGVWNFQWIAPPAGSGPVDFYGAFAVTRETTYTEKITIAENNFTGIKEINSSDLLSVYPNPVSSQMINLEINLKKPSQVNLKLTEIKSGDITELGNEFLTEGIHIKSHILPDLTKGIYILRIETEDQVVHKKMWVQ
ncbi:MAG: choice-of-anchor V domain-containing protein [Bacteroidota bacterium]|nr:choice-of-anchor V domain-containing protein [Bacteroidota bacterium]